MTSISFRVVLTSALLTSFPLSASMAQSPPPLSKDRVVEIVDSMARAYMAEKGPASMSRYAVLPLVLALLACTGLIPSASTNRGACERYVDRG